MYIAQGMLVLSGGDEARHDPKPNKRVYEWRLAYVPDCFKRPVLRENWIHCERGRCSNVLLILSTSTLSPRESRVIRSSTALAIVCDLVAVLFRSRASVLAENLFLRRQLALYLERKTCRRRPTPATKFALLMLSRFFPWASALAIVKPDTLVRWHRTGFCLV